MRSECQLRWRERRVSYTATAHGHGARPRSPSRRTATAPRPSRHASRVTPARIPKLHVAGARGPPSLASSGSCERRLAMEDNKHTRYFAHEKLDAYRLAFEVVEFVAARRDKLRGLPGNAG